MNYMESAVTGDSWTRCCAVKVANSYQQAPLVEFVEERLTALSDGRTLRESGAAPLSLRYEPGMQIPMRDPATGLPTGDTFPIDLTHAMMYSAYLYAAEQRDAMQAPPAEEPI